MILDTTSKSIEVVLSAAPVANQAQICASYADMDTSTLVPGSNDLLSNGTTAVTAVAAPAASKQRQLKYLSIYNNDTSSITVTVRLNNGGTIRNASSYTLSPQQTLQWTADQGFYVAQPNLANGISPGYIDGLKMIWVSNTAVSFSSGSAYIQSSGSVANLPSQFNLSGLSLSASTWYHAYLFLSSGVPTVELSSTAPATPYYGTARSKTGDTTRRYLGSVKTDASGNVFQFIQNVLDISYLMDVAITPAITRILAGGVATTVTTVNASVCAPVTSRLIYCNVAVLDTSASARIGNSDMVSGTGLSGTAALLNVVGGSNREYIFTMIPTNSSQAIQYVLAGTVSGAGLYLDLTGYTYER